MMFGLLSSLKRFKEFDKVTEFRLYTSILVAIGFGLLGPILVSLKGLYLLPWIISIFAIIQTLAVKTNNWFVANLSLDAMYKIGIFIHILFIVTSAIYFISPMYMVWIEGLLAIIEIAVFSAYSIALNNYLTHKFPDSMSDFQIVRNSSWADGYLIGLGLISLITYFGTISTGIIVFIIFNTLLSLYLIYNWNFYKDIDY
jgi:hypothetical protein